MGFHYRMIGEVDSQQLPLIILPTETKGIGRLFLQLYCAEHEATFFSRLLEVQQTVKDVLSDLQSDNLIQYDKIGTSNCKL